VVAAALEHLGDEALDAAAAAREGRVEEDETRPFLRLERVFLLRDRYHVGTLIPVDSLFDTPSRNARQVVLRR
jgi:hypothetical protein